MLPNFLKLRLPINYDNLIKRTSIQDVRPNTVNFNSSAQLNFGYDGRELYRLASSRTGFRCTFACSDAGPKQRKRERGKHNSGEQIFRQLFRQDRHHAQQQGDRVVYELGRSNRYFILFEGKRVLREFRRDPLVHPGREHRRSDRCPGG